MAMLDKAEASGDYHSGLSALFSAVRSLIIKLLRWSPVLMLENCGAWMERRSLEKARHCENVTRKCLVTSLTRRNFAFANKYFTS
jgi:hypothetical protein